MLESIVKCVQSHGKVLHTRKPRSRQRPMSNLVCLKKARKYRANCSSKALTERRVSAQRLKKHVFYELIVASRALPGRSALHSGAESKKSNLHSLSKTASKQLFQSMILPFFGRGDPWLFLSPLMEPICRSNGSRSPWSAQGFGSWGCIPQLTEHS